MQTHLFLHIEVARWLRCNGTGCTKDSVMPFRKNDIWLRLGNDLVQQTWTGLMMNLGFTFFRPPFTYYQCGYQRRTWVHIYLEYHYVCPLVGAGTPHPLSRKRVCPPTEPKGGGAHSPAGKGVGGVPIRTTGEKAYSTVYSVRQIYPFCIYTITTQSSLHPSNLNVTIVALVTSWHTDAHFYTADLGLNVKK